MEQILLAYLTKSLAVSAVAALVAAFGFLFGNTLPARTRYAIWLVVLAGLVIPLPQITGRGLFTLPHAASPPAGAPLAAALEAAPQMPLAPQAGAISAGDQGGQPRGGLAVSPVTLGLLLWGGVAAAVFARHIWQYLRFLRTIRRWGRPLEGGGTQDGDTFEVFRAAKQEMGLGGKKIRLVKCGFVTSSMLTGFFRPAILLPDKRLEADELDLIFRHELVHYKRGDLFVKFLAVLAVSVFWFNPFAYWLSAAIQAEGEASCDEAVLRGLGKEDRRFYAEIIIGTISDMNAAPTMLSTSFLYRGKFAIKKRMDSIMDAARKPKWPSAVTIAGAAALVFMSGSVFAFAAPPALAPAGPRAGVSTVACALNLQDGSSVTLEGRLEMFLGAEDFLLSDATGTLVVEISRNVWGNLSVSEHDTVEIMGEVENDNGIVIVEARTMRMVSPAGRSAQAGFSGPRAPAVSVAEAHALRDDAPVILQGRILQFLGHNRYIFEDDTGTVIIEMGRRARGGLAISPSDLVELSGEVERNHLGIEIEVKSVRKLP